MKIFLSHKMSGLTEDEVVKLRQEATEFLSKKYGDIELIDNYHHDDIPENAGSLWHLGTSIRQMEDADGIYFWGKISDAKGCLIEFMIATIYHLNILNIESEPITEFDPNGITDIVNSPYIIKKSNIGEK